MNIYCRNKERAEQVKVELNYIGEPADIIKDGEQYKVRTTEQGFRRWKM